MKKAFALLLVFAMILSLCACSGGGSTEPPAASVSQEPAAATGGSANTTIVWGDWMLSEDAYVGIYGAMVENFDAAHDNITVETYTQPYSSYLDQLLIASAAGNGPDVAHIKAEWLPQFLALGVVKDLYPYVSQEVLDDYSSSALEAATIDGKLVGMPWFCNAYAMFYNKALLEQAGITELPTTMDELMEDAAKIAALGTDENGNKIYGLALANSGLEASEGYNLLPVLWGCGAEYQDLSGKIAIASDEGIQAFTAIQDLYVNDISPKGASFKDIRNLFGQGVIGFYWDAEAALSPCAAAAPDKDAFYENVGAMVIPANDSPNGYGYLSERYMIVFNSCSDEKMEAVSEFLEYMSGSEAIQVLQDNNQGKMSSRSSVMDTVFANVDSEITKAFIQAMGSARSLPSGNLSFLDADEILSNAVTQLAQGADVTTVINGAQTQIQELYDSQ